MLQELNTISETDFISDKISNPLASNMKTFFSGLWLDDEGAELVEWVVIVALIGITGVTTYQALQGEMSGKIIQVLNLVSMP